MGRQGDKETRRQGDKGDKGDKGAGGAISSPLPITHYLFPITYSQLPIPNSQFPITFHNVL
nr:hypothetical protein [Hassalia byssoidea]